MNPIIKLNVSGTIFEVERDTLCRIPLFKKILDDLNDECTSDKPIWIPRSSKIFHHILAKAIDDNYNFPRKYNSELKYYGLEELSKPQSDVGRLLLDISMINIIVRFMVFHMKPGMPIKFYDDISHAIIKSHTETWRAIIGVDSLSVSQINEYFQKLIMETTNNCVESKTK